MKFISEAIEALFDTPPDLSKRPPAPDRFRWADAEFSVVEVLRQWLDRPRWSWGKGRVYFDVRTGEGRCFRLYYDRRPLDIRRRKGFWVLLAELEEGDLKEAG